MREDSIQQKHINDIKLHSKQVKLHGCFFSVNYEKRSSSTFFKATLQNKLNCMAIIFYSLCKR